MKIPLEVLFLLTLCCSSCAAIKEATYPQYYDIKFADHRPDAKAWACVEDDNAPGHWTCIELGTFIQRWEKMQTPTPSQDPSSVKYSASGDTTVDFQVSGETIYECHDTDHGTECFHRECKNLGPWDPIPLDYQPMSAPTTP